MPPKLIRGHGYYDLKIIFTFDRIIPEPGLRGDEFGRQGVEVYCPNDYCIEQPDIIDGVNDIFVRTIYIPSDTTDESVKVKAVFRNNVVNEIAIPIADPTYPDTSKKVTVWDFDCYGYNVGKGSKSKVDISSGFSTESVNGIVKKQKYKTSNKKVVKGNKKGIIRRESSRKC